MKLIKAEEAVGHALCHDLTKIVPGKFKGAAFRKGHVVTAEDIPLLLDIGKHHLYVLEMQPGMLHENEAAQILYRLCAGAHMAPSDTIEGKIELIAQRDGLFIVDVERLRQVNSMGEMMIATRHSHTPVKRGNKLAGARVIPLVIEEEKMKKAQTLVGEKPLLELRPYRPLRAGVITTGSEIQSGRVLDGFTPVVQQKLAEYGAEMAWHQVLGDEPAPVAAAILDMVRQGADLVLCTGGMSVDPDDRTPLAIRNTGAAVVRYGTPVLPGAMLMLAYLGDIPVLGLPGCVMYAKRTIFDLVLPRLAAGLIVTAEQLSGLGHGGLCLNCETCVFPICAFGTGV